MTLFIARVVTFQMLLQPTFYPKYFRRYSGSKSENLLVIIPKKYNCYKRYIHMWYIIRSVGCRRSFQIFFEIFSQKPSSEFR